MRRKPLPTLTTTELDWLAFALNKEIATLRHEAEENEGNGGGAIAEVMGEGRQNLAVKLKELIDAGAKVIHVESY